MNVESCDNNETLSPADNEITILHNKRSAILERTYLVGDAYNNFSVNMYPYTDPIIKNAYVYLGISEANNNCTDTTFSWLSKL